MIRLTLLALLTVVAASSAQSPCSTNLVANGDFAQVFPLWTASGPVTATFPTAIVDGVSPSRCLSLSQATGPYVVHAPNNLQLGSGLYEFSMDVVWSTLTAAHTIDVGLTPGGGGQRTSIGSTTLPRLCAACSGTSYSRLYFRFSAPNPGSFMLDLAMSTPGTVLLDNVTVHPGRDPSFNFTSATRAVGASNTFVIDADPNQFVAVLLAASFGPTLPVPPCSGEILIGPPPNLWVAIDLVPTGASGRHSGTMPIPAVVSGVALYWQAVAISPNCEIGCADMIAFR